MAQLVAHLLCKQGVRGSSPLGSTAGQRPFPLVGKGLCRVRTPEKYCSGVTRVLAEGDANLNDPLLSLNAAREEAAPPSRLPPSTCLRG